MPARNLFKEVYWTGIFIASSYLVIALNSSFSLNEPLHLCAGQSVLFSKTGVILQLAALLTGTRILFHYILKIENQNLRYFMIPIVLFALPASIIAVWIDTFGCK